LHLRAADKFVRLAHRYRSDIHVTSDGTRVDGKSILDLITLAAPCGSWLNIEASGPDAEAALAALSDLVEARFDEIDDAHSEQLPQQPMSAHPG